MSAPLRLAFNLNNRAVVQRDGDGFTGPAPRLAALISEETGCETQLIGLPDARSVVSGVGEVWDMAFLAADPRRTHLMQFSSPYLRLGATLLLDASRPERHCAEVFASGATILSTRGAAYHAPLSALADPARLVAMDTPDQARSAFLAGKAPALAALRSGLMSVQGPGRRLAEDDFATLEQSVAIAPQAKTHAEAVERAIARL